MLVVLSRSSLKDNYAVWLKSLYPGIVLTDAYSADERSLAELLGLCSGIMLTGGADVDPARYGMTSEVARCEGIDKKRDQVETLLIETAIRRKLPLLAVCRGIQLLNVCFGGSLIVDIPADHGKMVLHRGKKDVYHVINITKDSGLIEIGNATHHIVNSSHHQAIMVPGDGLVPVAWSEDGLIEAIELDHSHMHPFLLGIQWHPERMDVSHPMSGSVGRAFLQKTERYRK